MRIGRLIIVISAASATVASQSQVATDSGLQSTSSPAPAVPRATAEPTIPERSQIDEAFKQTSLGKDADERRMLIERRELANRVVNDPDIVAAKRVADSARTDLEKRQLLRNYYDLYYGRMRGLARDPETKKAIEQDRLAHISQTTQPRVRSVEDSGLPTPSPTPKKKEQKGGRFKKFQGGE
jgi:hypothetical protein